MTRKAIRLLVLLFAFLLAFYFIYQGYSLANPAYKTTAAMAFTVSDSIGCRGLAVRDEQPIDISGSGVKHYLVENGDKIAKGAVVAEVYRSVDDALDNLMRVRLGEELTALEEISDKRRSAGNAESLTASVFSNLRRLSASVADDSFDGLFGARTALTRQLAGLSDLGGGQVDLSARLAELEGELAALGPAAEPSGYVYAPSSGYFLSSCDGYEQSCGGEQLWQSDLARLTALVEGAEGLEPKGGCRVVTSYVWHLVTLVDSKYEKRFYEGQELSLDFNYALVKDLPATVSAVVTEAGSDQMAVIFESDYLSSAIAALRCEECEISFRNYSGIKVERTALRVEEGVVGVYIKYGTQVRFKTVDPVYETDDYILSRENTADEGALKLYDEIITEGKDLYVGMQLG